MSSEDLRKWGCWIPEDDPSDGEPDDSEPETDEPGLAEPEPAEPEPEPEPEPAEPEPAAPAPSDWADRAVEGDVASTLREQLGAWRRDWPITERLEAAIGCKVSELTAAKVDADDLVTIDDGGRPWEKRTVPKKRTTEGKYGEPVLKKRRDEGKKPATCTDCGNKFLSKSALTSGFTCVRGTKPGCGKRNTKYD